MKRFIRSSVAKKVVKKVENDTIDSLVTFNDQIKFQEYFSDKYGTPEDLFYFDGVQCVDNKSGESIKGANLGKTSKVIEEAIKKYYKIK